MMSFAVFCSLSDLFGSLTHLIQGLFPESQSCAKYCAGHQGSDGEQDRSCFYLHEANNKQIAISWANRKYQTYIWSLVSFWQLLFDLIFVVSHSNID